MPVIRKEKLWEDLKRGEIAPVYLLCGSETFQRERAVKFIADKAFSSGDMRDFNETAFSLNQADGLRSALAAAEQLPMMSVRRLIRVTDIRISAAGRSDTIKDDHENMLAAFLERPPGHAVVIFIADELNGTRKLSKLLKQKCISVEFEPLDDAGLTKWARTHAAAAGAEIDDATLRYLISRVNSNLQRLSNEIEKLTTAALPEKRITRELIDELAANTRDLGDWDFVNFLKAGRKADALTALKKMLDDESEPLMILGQMAGSYRRTALEGRSDPAKMAKRMRLLAETDLAMKTSLGAGGPFGMRMHLEKLTCELLQI
ncbi:MAG: DNA polymerase III subunit delta [Acidobacteriota bacterium]